MISFRESPAVSAAEVLEKASMTGATSHGDGSFEMISRLSIGRDGRQPTPVLEIKREVDGRSRWRSEARDLSTG